MMSPKTLGIVQLIGAIVAGYFGWQSSNWGILALTAVFLVTAVHHLTEEKR